MIKKVQKIYPLLIHSICPLLMDMISGLGSCFGHSIMAVIQMSSQLLTMVSYEPRCTKTILTFILNSLQRYKVSLASALYGQLIPMIAQSMQHYEHSLKNLASNESMEKNSSFPLFCQCKGVNG
jgi:hypothetical protein